MEKDKFLTQLEKVAWILVIYTLLVIVWGAWVRISHSGDGCGETWPLCRGVLFPQAVQKKTWIEYAHRAMSGAYGLIVIGIFLACWRKKDKFPWLVKPATYTLVFMITEALLGAKLVLFGLTGSNATFYRAFVMGLHQINSLLLVGSATWLALAVAKPELRLEHFRKILIPAVIMFLIASTGAWAALASTLFPSDSLLRGFMQDLSGDSNVLLRLRIIHPLIAASLGTYLAVKFWQVQAMRLSFFIVFAILFGMLTLGFLSPVWMKLTHLLIAHTLWIFLVSYGANSFDSVKR
ncbi:MAG: COX15/CtaA family protein [Bdellovibrionota bacterium]